MPRFIAPREHGAWSMLLLPFAAGLLIAGRLSWTIVPAAAALVAAFWLREPLIVLARQALIWRERRPEASTALRTAVVAGAVLAASSLALAAEIPAAPLIALGAGACALGTASIWSAVRNRQRSLWLQFVTAAALGSGAILASLAATAEIQPWAWWVWGASSLHSLAAVAVVRARLDARAAASNGRPRRRGLVATAAALIAAGAVAAVAVALSGRAWLSIAMAFSAGVHTYELARLSDRAALATPLHRVGWNALAASLAFTALVVAGAG